MSTNAHTDLHDRVVGNKYRNTEINESFTVVGVRGMFALIQYDDGVAWDEMSAPDLLTDDESEFLGVSPSGIDAAKYQPLGNGGPTLDDACADGNHDFYPTPAQLGLDDIETWHSHNDGTSVVQAYHNTTRCRTCSLSGSVLAEFLGHEPPTVCDRCEDEVLPSEDDDITFSPNPEWTDAFLCTTCAETVEEEYEPYEVSCFVCDTHLGTNEENSYTHATSIIGQAAGATPDDGPRIFLCDGCRSDCADGV